MDAGCRGERAETYLASAAPPPTTASARVASTSTSAVPATLAQAAGSRRTSAPSAVAAADAPWVSTGEAVDAQYTSNREAATDPAVQPNRLFDLATQAHQRGDKKAARDLSAQGRQWQAKMEELHAQAAGSIFQSRNSDGRVDLLDLHGLHPNEATEIVTQHVRQLQHSAKNRRERTFSVICGTGHHAWNTNKRSKLRDAVVDTLDRLRCTYRDASADRLGGMLSVVVPAASTKSRMK